MAEAREAFVTGIGILSCLGEGPQAHWQRLMEGKPETGAKTVGPYVVHPTGSVVERMAIGMGARRKSRGLIDD